MRQRVGEDTEERFSVGLLRKPLHRPLVDEVGRILPAVIVVGPAHRMFHILPQHLAHNDSVALGTTVTIKEVGEVEMCLKLTDVAIELVDATFVGRRRTSLIATCPLSEKPRGVSVVAHDFWQDDMGSVVRFLTNDGIVVTLAVADLPQPMLAVASHEGMTGVLTRHQRSPRRSGDRTAGIGRREAHSLGSKAVDVGCTDVSLSVASQVAPPHVVTHYIYNIRLGSRCAATTSAVSLCFASSNCRRRKQRTCSGECDQRTCHRQHQTDCFHQ